MVKQCLVASKTLVVELEHTHINYISTLFTPRMQARRGRCVRPSAPEKKSKHFVKVIHPSPIHSKQIRIPDEFIAKFGNELNNVATITVPDGRVWEMELKKRGNNVCFCNKWQQFAQHYSLGYGFCLCFKYEGNSEFSVNIFDITCVEIPYPPTTNDRETNIKCPNPRKSSKVVESQGKIVKSMSKHAFKRVEEAASQFNSNNPYFCSKITKNVRAVPYVTPEFAKYLSPNVPIKVHNSDGDHWEVSCVFYNARSSAMRMGRGFSKFRRDSNLSEGDVCVFELINENPVVLKVTMFRAVDYGD